MSERKNPEEPARTAEAAEEPQPGDERVARRGAAKEDPQEPHIPEQDDDDRFDAG